MIYCPAQNVDLMTNSSLLTSPDRIPELWRFYMHWNKGHRELCRAFKRKNRVQRSLYLSSFCLEKRLCLEPNTHFRIRQPLRYPLFINLEKKNHQLQLNSSCRRLAETSVSTLYNIYSTHVYNFLDSVRGELTRHLQQWAVYFFSLLSQPTACRNCSAKSASRH